jgi:tRNA/rRNA methyltransferase
VLFGSEKVGLSNEDLSHCHWLMHIPTRVAHPSMNLGQAVAVCLYEIIRSGKVKAGADNPAAAKAGELERLTAVLVETLRASGYLEKGPSETATAKIRRLVRRFKLQGADAELLLGMLRQIQWKIRSRD